MARLWQSGFELNTLTAAVELTNILITAPTIQTSIVRSGVYALEVSSLSSSTAQAVYYQYQSAEGVGDYYFRQYLRVGVLPSAENRIIVFNDGASLSTVSVYLTIDNSGTLKLYDEDGQITGTSTLSTGTWYRVEVHIDTTAAGGSHIIEGKVDGNIFATSSTRNIVSTNELFQVSWGGNLNSEGQTTGQWFFDDLAINNSTGSFQNSYPGAGSIIHLRPNAAGDNSDWSNDYQSVDEVTPDDNTTKTVSATLDNIDDHNIDDSGLTGSDTINVVGVGVRFRAASVTDPAQFVLRLKASSSGTVEESSAIGPVTTTWLTNALASPKNYPLVLYDLPGASTTVWTNTDLNNAQIGYRIATGGTNNVEISTVWMSVDYVSGGAITTSTSSTSSSTSSTSTSSTSTSSTSTSTTVSGTTSTSSTSVSISTSSTSSSISTSISTSLSTSTSSTSNSTSTTTAPPVNIVKQPNTVFSTVFVLPGI